MKNIYKVISVFFAIILFGSVFLIPKTNIKLVETKYLQPTPTINYYLEDLYAQCRGLEYFNGMIKDNESLNIYENFQKEYQKTVNNIERDKKELGLTDFVCPQDKITKVGN